MDLAGDASKNFEGETPGQNDRLLKNIKLADLANQFESVLQRVKELELHHLIEPIQSTAHKLRQLEEITGKLACDYYDNYTCTNKDCCNELDVTKSLNIELSKAASAGPSSAKKDATDSDQSDKCVCRNADGTKFCQCDSEVSVVKESSRSQKAVSDLRNNETCGVDVEKSCAGGKCNPCKCALDTSGRKMKTLDCKSAARERRRRRYEEQITRRKADDRARSLPADAKLPAPVEDDLIVERRVSNSRFQIQAAVNHLSLSVNKESTVIQDTAYVTAKEKNQAIFCNLSSESSSEEYDSDYSDDERCGLKNCISETDGSSNDPTARCSIDENDECWTSDSNLGSCGCGHKATKGAVGENKTLCCPCGCGDLMDLPAEKYARRSCCRCEKCGQEILESWPLEQAAVDAAKPVPFNNSTRKTHQRREIIPADEKLPRDDCVIPYTDVRKYIEELEDKCRVKDEVIEELIKSRGYGHAPSYIA